MTISSRTIATAALALGILLPCAHASSIDAIYMFGDSLSDAGNVFVGTGGAIPAPPYVGTFSNGPVWVQDLAVGLGLAPLTPSLAGGTDYAYGGGESAPETYNGTAVPDPTDPRTNILGPTGQLAQYEGFLTATHQSADPNALYTIWIGANDLVDILSNDPANASADVATVAANIDSTITQLAALGAKNFLVLTVPNLGDTPAAIQEGAAAQAALTNLSIGLNTALVGSLGPLASADHVNLDVLNTYLLLNSIVANPSQYGLSDATHECVSTTPPDRTGPGPLNYTECSNPNSYLFWDFEHPTAAGQQLIANAALTLVSPEPGSIALISVGLIGLFLIRRRATA